MNEGARLLKSAPGSQGAKARRLDITPGMMSMLCAGKRTPGEELRRRIEALYKVPFAAWERVERDEDDEPVSGPVEAEDAPAVERGDQSPPASPPAGELSALRGGTPVERARALLDYLATPGRTSTELAQARELRHALTLEARMLGAMSTKARLHEHPEWGAWVEQLVEALASVPGALEALEALLAAEPREAAAA